MPKSTCSIDGCENASRARGWCWPHYKRWHRFGTTDATRPPTEDRFWAKVQKMDPCWWWTGSLIAGYGSFSIDSKSTPAHRYSYVLANGPIPDGLHLDHICHNRACVNPEHLRPVTQKQNAENHQGPQINSKTGVRGVYVEARTGKYVSIVNHFGKRHYLGQYDSLFLAESAVIAKRLELFTHNDHDRKAS
jgi:hypothetical protein